MSPSVLITGAEKGIGRELADLPQWKARSVSRSNGFDIGNNQARQKILALSLEHDIVVNLAHNGHFSGQVQLIYDLFELWQKQNKKGLLVSVGSSATYLPPKEFKRYSVIKKSLQIAHQQCAKKLEAGSGQFRMTLITPGFLDTENNREKGHRGLTATEILKTIEFLYQAPEGVLFPEIISVPIQPKG